jgi:putative transposase
MEFTKGQLYHVFNQGNNRQKIFFNHENYLFFIEKIRTYILPYADILAWTLMPNHFHLMILVKEEEIELEEAKSDTMTPSHRITKTRSFNNSIGILLRSYTRAINKQQNLSGSLFKAHTKAECIAANNKITPSFMNTNQGTLINIYDPDKEYAQTCFDYIHQNPVKAKLVKNAADWEYSSAMDYAGFRNGNLINKESARLFVTF